MYEIIIDKEAIKYLERLPKDKGKQIFDKILSTKENPFLFFEKLTARKDYKLRVGKYRVIADINQQENRIEITRIGLRKNIYKNK